MKTFWVTFRIGDSIAGGRTYEQCYDAFTSAIAKYTDDYWDDPTSFAMFSTTGTIAQIALDCRPAISPTYDMFLIGELDKASAIVCGLGVDDAVFRLMPYAKHI